MGAIHEREPIEAIWGALKSSGKKPPGYWDTEARRLRADEDAKGRAWFAASNWQSREERLFNLAGKVSRTLASAPVPPK